VPPPRFPAGQRHERRQPCGLTSAHASPAPPARRGSQLIELLVVIIILGILLAIAVPSYIGFKSKAEKSAAQANVRAAVPAVEAFYADNGTYVGVDNASTGSPPGIAFYDPASAAKVVVSTSPAPSSTSYCVYSTAGGATFFKLSPSGTITQDAGPVLTDCNTAT
jgi:type IV pilus assembly protein PilA